MKEQDSNVSGPRPLSDVIADIVSSINLAQCKADEAYVQVVEQVLTRLVALSEIARDKTEFAAALAALGEDVKKELHRIQIEEATVDLQFAIVDQGSDPKVLVLKDELESAPSSHLSSIQLRLSGSPLVEKEKANSGQPDLT